MFSTRFGLSFGAMALLAACVPANQQSLVRTETTASSAGAIDPNSSYGQLIASVQSLQAALENANRASAPNRIPQHDLLIQLHKVLVTLDPEGQFTNPEEPEKTPTEKTQEDSKEDELAFKVVASQLKIMAEMASIVQMVGGVVDFDALRGPVKQAVRRSELRYSHNGLISLMRVAAGSVSQFLPPASSELGFRYLTETFQKDNDDGSPSKRIKALGFDRPNGHDERRFATVSEIQAYMYQNLLGKDGTSGSLSRAIETVTAVTEEMQKNPSLRLTIDNAVAMGPGSFGAAGARGEGRFQQIAYPEIALLLAGLHMARHDVLMGRFYNFDDWLVFANSVARDFGEAAFKIGGPLQMIADIAGVKGVPGVPAETIANTLKSYPDLLTMKPEFKKDRNTTDKESLKAFGDLIAAIKLARSAYDAVKQSTHGPDFITRSRIEAWLGQGDKVREFVDGVINTENMDAANAFVGAQNLALGETVKVNLKAFYANPPASLRDFLPTDFDQGQVEFDSAASERNYFKGRPVAWASEAFAPYVQDQNGAADPSKAARVLGGLGGTAFNNVGALAILGVQGAQ